MNNLTSCHFPKDGKLLFIRSKRGVCATIRFHRLTERFFAPRDFDPKMNPRGQADWICEPVANCRATNCFQVKPVKRIWRSDRRQKERVGHLLNMGKKLLRKNLGGCSWEEVTEAYGEEEALEEAKKAYDKKWEKQNWEWLEMDIPEEEE